MWTFQILRDSIDLTQLNWYEIQAFPHRTYYQCDELYTWKILAFSEPGDEIELGSRLIDPGRFITIQSEERGQKILIPIESISGFRDSTDWIEGKIDEALWLSGRTDMLIAVDSEDVQSNFAVNCVYSRERLEEMQRIEELRQDARKNNALTPKRRRVTRLSVGNPNFKPKWLSGRTTVIRVPEAIANQVLAVAHQIDQGEPLSTEGVLDQ